MCLGFLWAFPFVQTMEILIEDMQSLRAWEPGHESTRCALRPSSGLGGNTLALVNSEFLCTLPHLCPLLFSLYSSPIPLVSLDLLIKIPVIQ